jgi:RND family efflux transporter MFP subunit
VAENERSSILDRIRDMAAEVGGVSDAQLLDRFAANRDEAAFELLLWRHSRLVFGVCARVLRDMHDAEDAFQATYLVLARRAGRIARREAVAGWLYKVAYRVALTARDRRARREAREKLVAASEHPCAAPNAPASVENMELRGILDQEIGRLPARFRSVIVLCYLEGKSVDEAAMLLGCPRGTVASRLSRGRERLRARLAGRGLAATAALAILSEANAAPRPLSLISTLTAAALRYTAKGAAANAALSHRITVLTEEVLRAMLLNQLKTSIVIVIAFAGILLVGSALAVSLQGPRGQEGEPQRNAEASRARQVGGEKQAGEKPVSEDPRTVTVSRPTQRKTAPYEEYAGPLESLRIVEVRPAVSGVVEKVGFKAGARVKKGDVLFVLDSRASQLALEKSEAELALAEAKKKRSDVDLARAVNLRKAKSISNDEVDKFTEQAAIAEAAVKIAKVEVARARLDLQAATVTAPMDGQAGRPLVEPGTLVFRGQDRATLLTTVTSSDPIGLTIEMDEQTFLRYQRHLREKQVKGAGSALRMALGDENGFPHEGTLENFDDRINPKTGMVLVHGSFPNRGQTLLPGMFARVRIPFGLPRAVLVIPEEAILSDQQAKKYVLVVARGDVAQRRDVTLGQADDGMRIIEKGLGAEDRVIVAGLANIRPGDPVQPREKAEPKR